MMSNILEKTLGTLMSPSDPYKGLQGLFHRCLSAKTKQEEAGAVQYYLSIIRDRLKEPGNRPSFIGHCLAFTIFADMIGYPTDFAHIHAINLAQQSSMPEKKMGYAACCWLLKEGNDLCLLLVNTLVRDLTCSNVVIIGMALSALCSAPLPADAIPTLLPGVQDRLAHPAAYVRSRAVIAAHHLLKTYPEQCSQLINNLVARLGDADPHVVARTLSTIPDILQASPESMAGLVTPLVAIQRQILGGKLPPDMVYQGLQDPWAQLAIIRILPELALSEEEEKAACEVLIETLSQAGIKEGSLGYQPPIRAALVSQSLAALMSLESPSEASRIRALQHASSMLTSPSNDVKQEGLQLLGLILARHETTLTSEQRTAVHSSLEHPDVSVRRRGLALLAVGAGPGDVQQVCGQLFSHASSADPHMRSWLLEQALTLIGRFPEAVSADWQLSALVKLLPLAEEKELNKRIFSLCQNFIKGNIKPETRTKLLSMLTQHANSKEAPTCLLRLYVWTLSNLPQLVSENETNAEDSELRGAVGRLIMLGRKVYSVSKSGDAELLLEIVRGCSKALEKEGTLPCTEPLTEFLKQVRVINSLLELACSELLNSLPVLSTIQKILSEPDPPFDCTLASLDEFIEKKLRNKECEPYDPQRSLAYLQKKSKVPALAPLTTLFVESFTISQKAREFKKESSGAASEDSWSAKSCPSTRDVVSPDDPPPVLLWSKSGRVKSPEVVPESATTATLAIALTGSTQVTTTTPAELSNDDPLGDLLR